MTLEIDLQNAIAWLEQDPDAVTRKELEQLVTAAKSGDAAAAAELSDRFDTRLSFGTAGLRGQLGSGPNRMNRVLVSQAAHGFGRFLLGRTARPRVVIGYDGRINSDVFARDSAEIMTGLGIEVLLFDEAVPTPVVATALRELDFDAAVVVTASHNPPQDNGYKVYLGGEDNGSQIVSPADKQIESLILESAKTNVTEYPRNTEYGFVPKKIVDAYIEKTAAISSRPETPVPFVYTAMHGVGWKIADSCFKAAALGDAVTVTEQIEPNGNFPTVAFPNPEEPGALDLAYKTADEAGIELVVANDPDADRLAIAVKENGSWRRLTGNEVGALLGWRAAERSKGNAGSVALAASLVSSPALAAVASEYGIPYTDTLTGFKFVSRVSNLIFGYEEALGYLVDPIKVRDKDGISAAVDFLAMAGELQARGVSVTEHLEEFAARFGAFASSQISIRVKTTAEIPELASRFRSNPPTAVGGLELIGVDDFQNGFENYPATDLIRLWFQGGTRVIVRPSGTEPKLKIYIDAAVKTGESRSRKATELVSLIESDLRGYLNERA